jgi:hypothetical protein
MLNDNKITPIELLILAKMFTFTTQTRVSQIYLNKWNWEELRYNSCPRFI